MSLSDLVVVNVSATSVNPTRPGFGTPLIAAYHTHYTDRIRYYTSLTAMVTDGFSVNEAAYKAASAIMAQSPTVAKFAVGRRALKTSQTLNWLLTSTSTSDVYAFTLIGSDGVSHAISVASTGVAATDATSVSAAINAITGHATTIGTATTSTATVILTRTDGLFTDCRNWPVSIMQLADVSADPGIATDLAAILAADPVNWYGLCLDSNSALEIEAAASWTESNKKLFSTNNSDFGNTQGGVSTDVFSVLKTAAYAKTFCVQNNTALLNYAGAAMLGNRLPSNPGSDTWAYKTLNGVPADSQVSLNETMQLALIAKNGNYYTTVAGVNISFPGQAPGTQFMDISRFIDWVQLNMQIDILALFASQQKVPYTDVGIDMVANVVKNRLKLGASPAFGGIDGTQPIVVTFPTLSQTLPTDRTSRNLPNGTFSARLAGAIHTVLNLNGTLSF